MDVSPLLQPGVPGQPDVGQLRHLLATQARDPARPPAAQADIIRPQPRPARAQERPHLPASIDARSVTLRRWFCCGAHRATRMPHPASGFPGAVSTRIVALWNVRQEALKLLCMSQQPRSSRISSADGTTIVFDRYGEGKPLILIGGASYDRSAIASVAEAIADDLLAI